MTAKKNSVLKLHEINEVLYNASSEREENYLGKKIAEGRMALGLSLTEFQELLQNYGVTISRSAINKWEVGATVPNAYQLLALGQALQVEEDMGFFMSTTHHTQLNLEGIQKLRAYREDLVASGRYLPQRKASEIIRYREMPVSNLAASAGVGEFLDECNFELVSFPESSIPAHADFAIRVAGDSMEPVYQNGQYVWVQCCERLHPGEVGIFVYDGDGYIKVYQEQSPDEWDREEFTDSYGVVHQQAVLVSYNPKYEPKIVSTHVNFQIIGRVLN